ncbi:aquaporin-11-like [Argonauta hians]
MEEATETIINSVTESTVNGAAAEVVAEAAEAIVNGAAETLNDVVAEALSNGAAETLNDVVAEALSNGAAETLNDVVAEALSNGAAEALSNGAAEALNDVVTEAISNGAAEALSNGAAETLSDVVTEALSNGAAETLNDVVTEAFSNGAAEAFSNGAAKTLNDVVAEAISNGAAESLGDVVAEALSNGAAESMVEEAVAESIVESAAEAFVETAAETLVAGAAESVLESAANGVIENSVVEESVAHVLAENVNHVIGTSAATAGEELWPLNLLGYEPMNYRQLYQMVVGESLPEGQYLEPYMASITYFLIVITLGLVLRKLTKVIMPGQIQVFLLEFIATMEVCSYFFENNFVLKHYGYGAFFVAIVLEILISNRTLGGASENPIKALDEFSERHIGFDKALLKIVVQCLGGLAAYRLAKLVWSLDMIEDHHLRFYEVTCETDLVTSILLGFMVEMGAAFIDTYLGKQSLSSTPFIDELIKAVNGGLMIIGGVSLTGMYFNPAMATGHMLGCKGTEMWEHLIVYWAGPFIGCLCAIILNKFVRIENGLLA